MSIIFNGTSLPSNSNISFNGTSLEYGKSVYFNGSNVFTRCYIAGTNSTLYSHSSGQSAVGEGFWRVLESWTVTSCGSFNLNGYISMSNASKIVRISVFINGSQIVELFHLGEGTGWWTVNSSYSYNTTSLNAGDVISIQAYLWGNYGSDHIDSSSMYVQVL